MPSSTEVLHRFQLASGVLDLLPLKFQAVKGPSLKGELALPYMCAPLAPDFGPQEPVLGLPLAGPAPRQCTTPSKDMIGKTCPDIKEWTRKNPAGHAGKGLTWSTMPPIEHRCARCMPMTLCITMSQSDSLYPPWDLAVVSLKACEHA